jgi:D-glycero-D-manno-heptose 1,7-bisphosphate phosphatase
MVNRNLEKKAIYLDRDGVINSAISKNGLPFPPSSVDQVIILPGVEEGLKLFRDAKFEIIVVTNQPEVSRGQILKETVEEINFFLGVKLGIKHFYVCYHDDSDKCLCRKPAPGLLINSAKNLGISLSRSYMVGDRWKDIVAGQRAGCRCFFIDYKYKLKYPEKPYITVKSLVDVAKIIRSSETK